MACKPGSVRLINRRQSFIWDSSHREPLATYPNPARVTLSDFYLVLLQAGFTLPSALPRMRCALAAPFHPYLHIRKKFRISSAVYFLWHFPSVHTAQALPGTLPCGARTFLPFANLQRATAQPTPFIKTDFTI